MSLSKLYGFIVYKCKIDPNYFFDEMTPKEVSALMDAYYEEHKERWEMLRLVNHATISSQSSKPVKPTDIMKFVWDNEKENEGNSNVSKEDIERMRKKLNVTD